jgi:hypothetical protein
MMHSLHRVLQTKLGKEQNVFAGEHALAHVQGSTCTATAS